LGLLAEILRNHLQRNRAHSNAVIRLLLGEVRFGETPKPAREARALPNPRMTTKLKFFPTSADFRIWLEKNHATATELWVGFYKKDSGRPSITWPESVDEALCFGWIDGIRKRVDEISYKIRFTPRRRGSIWSAINIKRAGELTKEKRMRPAGLKAFAARIENKSGIYSYEQRPVELPGRYAKLLKKNKAAWNFFQAQQPSYQKGISWWVVSAKKDETRLNRLAKLIRESAKRKRVLP
jgi:uncharacterized protein YdeI (YjbR/CyaY-like superfamily)